MEENKESLIFQSENRPRSHFSPGVACFLADYLPLW